MIQKKISSQFIVLLINYHFRSFEWRRKQSKFSDSMCRKKTITIN